MGLFNVRQMEWQHKNNIFLYFLTLRGNLYKINHYVVNKKIDIILLNNLLEYVAGQEQISEKGSSSFIDSLK